MSFRVLIKAPLSIMSGYGNDGLGIVKALLRAGVDVSLQPTHVDAPLPQEIANLLTKGLKGPYDLLINHVDPAQLSATYEVSEACDVVCGWTMWEMDSLANMEVEHREKIRDHTQYFDAILNYDLVGHDALRPYLVDSVKTGVLQGGYWPDKWPFMERNWIDPERFVFAMVGVLGPRKAPFDALQAFNELQEEHPEEMKDVWLALKSTNMAPLHPAIEEACPNVKVYNETWEEETLRAFYGSVHCLLAPSRGEGKNMPALEMLSTGGTVLATNWGGHRGWLSDLYAYPINYQLQSVSKARYGDSCRWAVVDKEHLKSQMLHIVRNREEARKKGEIGARLIPESHSWDVVMARFFTKLEELLPEKGSRLKYEYEEAKAAKFHGNR